MVAMKLQIKQMGGRTYYYLWCPGCNDLHMITDAWQYDGNREQPTFEPSILSKSHGTLDGQHAYTVTPNCHSFVRNGQWQFLQDCDHELKGQTVDMVDLPDWVI